MTARKPLPNHLVAKGFSVPIAQSAGVPKHRLQARDLVRPYWGLRAPVDAHLSLLRRCQLLGLALPDHAFFSGATAAALLGLPVPLRFIEPSALLEVAVPHPARAIRRGGARGRRLQMRATDVTARHGIRLTSPTRTWCDLAPALSLAELVAAGDYLIFHKHPIVTSGELAAAVAAHPGRRWRSKLRRALGLLNDHSESPRESILRVIVVTHGFPAPRANVELYDENGRFVARVDLLFEDYREVFEYQGDHHRTDIQQWRRDLSRKAEIESLDYHVTEVSADDLVDVPSLVRRLERNLRRRGWTGHATYDP
ncbi:type IV toxin-antitoxin system AbiEi family antitoxin [Cryobacterium tepidiphilum]|uniref:type IV toxin-antitoxin system AbiEi family antitoxin n=1 Tax=Cryobacterium tepidiphilum TaxID=2486026 RepID=UPI0011CE720D|nr:hypothetical protein [Cryobacterium tepidiphilum]